MPSDAAKKFAENCAEYVLERGGTGEAHAKMIDHIEKSIPDEAQQIRIKEIFASKLQMDSETSASEDSEMEENDEESGDEVPTGEDDGENVFDIDRFSKGGKFDQEGAEEAFQEWQRERASRKRPLQFDVSEEGPPPDISEDVFHKKQRELTERLITRDVLKMKEIESELASPDLSPRDHRLLTQRQDILQRTIKERRAQMK